MANSKSPLNNVHQISPIMHDPDKPSDTYIGSFLKYASGFTANKFHIGLRGEYVEKALTLMQRNAATDKYTSAPKLFHQTAQLKREFGEWVEFHWNNNDRMLNMYWNCESITLPVPTLDMLTMKCIDSVKGMTFSVPGNIQPGKLSLKIVDNSYLMWFNFFNALFNAQISPLVLRAKSGFHKIDINVELLGGNAAYNDDNSVKITDLDVLQVSEYNSAVIISAPIINPDNSKADLAGFTVDFNVPNPLNGTFKRSDRGMMDNTTVSSTMLKATKTGMDYDPGFWERTRNNMTQNALSYESLNATEEKAFNERISKHGNGFPFNSADYGNPSFN